MGERVGLVGVSIIGLALDCRDAERLADTGDVVAASAVGEQAVMSDAMEARGQHVDQEAADELVRCARHGLVALVPFAPVVLVREGDAAVASAAGGAADPPPSPGPKSGRKRP